jgi:hypothetical protein
MHDVAAGDEPRPDDVRRLRVDGELNVGVREQPEPDRPMRPEERELRGFLKTIRVIRKISVIRVEKSF